MIFPRIHCRFQAILVSRLVLNLKLVARKKALSSNGAITLDSFQAHITEGNSSAGTPVWVSSMLTELDGPLSDPDMVIDEEFQDVEEPNTGPQELDSCVPGP